jgi:hypothetical protein
MRGGMNSFGVRHAVGERGRVQDSSGERAKCNGQNVSGPWCRHFVTGAALCDDISKNRLWLSWHYLKSVVPANNHRGDSFRSRFRQADVFKLRVEVRLR